MYKQLGSHSECVSDKVRYFNFIPYAGVYFISTPQESRQTLYLLFLNTSPFLSKRQYVSQKRTDVSEKHRQKTKV